MQKKQLSIQEFLVRHNLFIALISFGLLLVIWIMIEYADFASESQKLRAAHLDAQKELLRNEVDKVVDYVEYMKAQTEKRLKSELQARVNEAIDIATNI